MKQTLISWNVNGIRAVEKKDFLGWLKKTNPDVLCVQETKAQPDQLGEALKAPAGYETYWNSAERKGYSGVAVFSRLKPVKVSLGLNQKAFDAEGRIITLEYRDFIVFNIYFPNGKSGPERLAFKLDFYREFFRYLEGFKKKNKPLLVCGDFNTAHQEIDLARPKENRLVSGFLDEERALIDEFVSAGFVDTFRHFDKTPGNYSWWDLKSGARSRNVGWRIDYFFIDKKSLESLKSGFILKDVIGSDHCPVGVTIDV